MLELESENAALSEEWNRCSAELRAAEHKVQELERRGGRYGLQTICEASGTANTTIIERLA